MLEGKTLYEALDVDKNADQSTIRKAYLKLAVQLHPDKNPDDPQANDRFQTLQKIYGILSDQEKRRVYDLTGSIEDSEDLTSDQFNDLYEYYRSMFAPVTEDAIEDFHDTFRGSDDEKAEVLKYYEKFRGDMEKVFDWVMCSSPDVDSHRFMDIIQTAIGSKQVKKHSTFTAWAEKVALKPAPKDPLRKTDKSKKSKGKKIKKDDEKALVEMIRNRNGGAGGLGGLIAQLESKYGAGDDECCPLEDEPTEEEFLAARKRLEEKKRKSDAAKQKSKGGAAKKPASKKK